MIIILVVPGEMVCVFNRLGKINDLVEAKKKFINRKKHYKYLRNKFNEENNSSEIKITYDLLAGSYIEHFNNHRFKQEKYSSELAHILNNYVQDGDTLLDVGSGEFDHPHHCIEPNQKEFSDVLAFDISWSRLKKGLEFYSQNINRTLIFRLLWQTLKRFLYKKNVLI